MLAVSKLLQKLSLAPQPDELVEELLEELQMKRGKVEDTIQDLFKLKCKYSDELRGLRTKLIQKTQVPSVLCRSFTMMTIEECLSGHLPEIPELEGRLKQEIESLEQKVLDLEAENYARAEETRSMAAEKQGLHEALVTY
jgi:hypothetical protein